MAEILLDRSVAPDVHPLPAPSLPPVRSRQLACGARLLTLDGAGCEPPVFQLKVLVSGAGRFDRPGGVVPQMLALTIDQGAGTRDAAALADLFESNGAWLGQKLHPRHCELSLRGLDETASEIVPAFLDMVSAPAFEPQPFDAVRVMKEQSEAISQGKPMTMATREMLRRLFGDGHPGAVFPALGDYGRVGRDDVSALHADAFLPAGMTFYLSGHVDRDFECFVAECIDRALAVLPSAVASRIRPVKPLPQPGRTVLELDGNRQAAVSIGVPAIMRQHPDFEMLHVAVAGLGGYFGSRLVTNLREERGLTYDISATLEASRDGAYMKISTECRLDDADDAVDEIFSEIRRFVAEPPRGEELHRLAGQIQTGLVATLDSPFRMLDHEVMKEVTGAPDGYFARSWQASERATPDELARVVGEHLSAPAVTVVVK